MKRYSSGISAQHAPVPFTAWQAEVSAPLAPCGTVHTACSTPQLNIVQANHRISPPRMTLTIPDSQELNRLARAQPSGPISVTGGCERVPAGTGGPGGM